jgi:hypothetical protein
MVSHYASAMRQQAQAWPVSKSGFRLRGHDMTRTEAFTDAAFAFAVTLLVISVGDPPGTYEKMLDAVRGIPAFAVSFALIMLFWYGHWQWSRRFGLEDLPSIMLSATLVFTVLVYVYPLKFIFSLMMFWLSGRRVSVSAIIEGPEQLYTIFAIYGVGFVAMALIVAGLNVHAFRCRDELELNELEQFDTRAEITSWLILASIGGISVALALFTQPSPFAWPGWSYMLCSFAMPWHGVRTGRARERLLAAANIEATSRSPASEAPASSD